MNRREFIKSLMAGVVGVCVPALVVAEKSFSIGAVTIIPAYLDICHSDVAIEDFDSSKQYGDFVILNNDTYSSDEIDKVIDVLERNARQCIPTKYMDKVAYVTSEGASTSDPFNELFTVSWRYTP